MKRIVIITCLLFSGCGLPLAVTMGLVGAGVAGLTAGGMYYYANAPTPTSPPTATPLPAPPQ